MYKRHNNIKLGIKKWQHDVKQTEKLIFKCKKKSKHSVKKHKNANLDDKKS